MTVSRRSVGFTAAESEAGFAAPQRVQERFPTLDEAAINQAVAALGRWVDVTDKKIAQAAFHVQRGTLSFDPKSPELRRTKAFQFAEQQGGSAFRRFVEREAADAAKSARQAVEESRAAIGTTVDIQEFIRRQPGRVGKELDPDRLAKIRHIAAELRGKHDSSRARAGRNDR